jgi:predicted ATPase
VLAALNVRDVPTAAPDEQLVGHLRERATLLVLDNCEHLAAPVARLVGQALTSARNVRWLTTSQEPLRLAGEAVYRLHPLDLPRVGSTLDDGLKHGAMALFCKLAATADHRFVLDVASLPLAIDLCRQLEGLPLAIEMAAARVPTLGLEGVRAQLGQRLQLPSGRRDAPPRHHTLRSTLDWSYGLLTESERRFFRRLEPFLGGFTAEMAAGAAGEPETATDATRVQGMELLAALVEKSLVQRSDSPGRYRLFESAREYAREKSAELGETSLVRRRHAAELGRWFAQAQSDYQTLPDADWAARYRLEWHNARAALAWACTDGDPDLLAILVAAVGRLDAFAQSPCEIVHIGVPLDRLGSASPALRAAACIEFSWAHYAEGNRETGTQLALRALDDCRQLGDTTGEYRALAQLVRLYESRPGHREQAEAAWVALCRIEDARVPLRTRLTCAINSGLYYSGTRTVAKLEELESIARASGFESLAQVCKVHVTDQMLIESRFAEAADAASRYLGAGTLGPRITALLHHNLCLALVHLGRTAEARHHAREAVRIMPGSAYIAVDAFAFAAAREGRLERAAVLFGYADRIKRERDEGDDPAEALVVADAAKRLAEGVDAARLKELMNLGAGMSPTQILALAFDF